MKHSRFFRMLRTAVTMALTVSVLSAGTPYAASAATVPGPTYRMWGETRYITTQKIHAANQLVMMKVYIEDDPGTSSIMLSLDVDEHLKLKSPGFAEPYCYGDGDYRTAFQAITNEKDGRFLWVSGKRADNMSIINDQVKDESKPFVVFYVYVPQDTPSGIYEIDFLNTEIYDAESDKTIRTLYSTRSSPDGTTSEYLNVKYKKWWIGVGDPYLRGDVTQDGVVDTDDAVKVMKNYAKQVIGDASDFDVPQTMAADATEDCTLDTDDAVAIMKYYAYSIIGWPSWDDVVKK